MTEQIIIKMPEYKEGKKEYIIEKDGKFFDRTKNRSKMVSIVNELSVSAEIIYLLKQRSSSVLDSFNKPELTYIHKGNKSKELKKIPILEAVVSELKSESASPESYSLFEQMLYKLKNPKLPIDPESVYFSYSFYMKARNFSNYPIKFQLKTLRLMLPSTLMTDEGLLGGNYVSYLTPNQIAYVQCCAPLPMLQAMEICLKNIKPKSFKLYEETVKLQKKYREDEERLKSGEFSQEEINNLLIPSTIGFDTSGINHDTINLPNTILQSACNDLIHEEKSIEEISKLFKLSENKIKEIIEDINKRNKIKRNSVRYEVEIKDYIIKRNSTCYRIAKLYDYPSIEISKKLRFADIESIDSYKSMIKDFDSPDEYIKAFEEKYDINVR